MKALFAALTLMLFLSNPIDGQKLVDPDNTWNIADCSQSGPECWTYSYKFDEDSTLIRGKHYHELLRSQEKSGNNWNTTSDYMREENNQVWYIDDRNPKIEILLYDFNLVVGDTFIINAYEDFIARLCVKKMDSIEYGNILRKRITLYSTNNEFYKMQWVEGIGDLDFWLGSKWVDVADGGEGWLLCHSFKDETIYMVERHYDCWFTRTNTDDEGSPTPFLIYPNPAHNELTISNSAGDNSNEKFTIINQFGNTYYRHSTDGKIDISSLPVGLYFIKSENQYVGKFVKL